MGILLSAILCTALVLSLSPTPIIADSNSRVPDYGPPGGSATAYELAAAIDIPAESIVSASLGNSDSAGAHVFQSETSVDLTPTGFVYPTGQKPTFDPPDPYPYGAGEAKRYYGYAGWLARGNVDSDGDYEQSKFHTGVDINAAEEDAVYAVADGTIVRPHQSDDSWGNGNYGVFIKSELQGGQEYLSLYGHIQPLDSQAFAIGQEVTAGEHFAQIGPFYGFEHLHFGIYEGTVPPPTRDYAQDPEEGFTVLDNYGWGRMGLNHWPDPSALPLNYNGFVDPIKWIQERIPQSPVSINKIAGFPTEGNSFAAISSGNAENAPLPNNSGSLSTVLSGLNNNQGNDMVQLTLELEVPSGAEYWAVDWRFLSEEYPEWVGSRYNDAFLIETPSSTFTISGSDIVAPNNVATDPSGELVTVNTVGAVGMSAANSMGTTYDGATETFTTLAPIPSGANTVTIVFSVMDLGDSIYDTTVFLDNFRFSDIESPILGLAEDTSSDLKEWANFMVEFFENKAAEAVSAGFFIGHAAWCAVLLIPPATPAGAGCLGVLAALFFGEQALYWTAYFIANDPPDDNFHEVVPIEPVVPWEPYCGNCTLALAQAEYGTALAEQQAILAAILTTLERLQGAAIADELGFFIMQAEALRDYMELARAKQDQVSSLLTQLGEQVVATIGPIQEEIIEISLRVFSEGFSEQEREELLAGGLSEIEIQAIEELFQSAELTEELISDILPAIALWNQEIENIVTPALDQAIEDIDNMLLMLENPESNQAPAFDFPPTPPAGSEYLVGTGETLSLLVQASDQDLSDEVSLILFEPPTGAALNVSTYGQVSTGNLTWIPTADQVGVHILTIIASDKYGLTAPSYQIVVVVQLDNQPPIADAGPDQTVYVIPPATTAMVSLNGSGSYDPDGDPLTYNWTWDGNTASGVSPTVELPLGATTITLVVNDGQVDSEPDTVDIAVNVPPTISYTPKYFLFAAREDGENPQSQTMMIRNFGPEGCAPLEWIVSDGADWLTLSPTDGTTMRTIPGDQVDVSVDISGMTAGRYFTWITIEAPGATNTPQQVPVFLTVQQKVAFFPFPGGGFF
jgi:murein DD-endopeptidase MepM/ murein hydrolase activator NlpD